MPKNNISSCPIHIECPMINISDPNTSGHSVKDLFKDLFANPDATFAELGVDTNSGMVM